MGPPMGPIGISWAGVCGCSQDPQSRAPVCSVPFHLNTACPASGQGVVGQTLKTKLAASWKRVLPESPAVSVLLLFAFTDFFHLFDKLGPKKNQGFGCLFVGLLEVSPQSHWGGEVEGDSQVSCPGVFDGPGLGSCGRPSRVPEDPSSSGVPWGRSPRLSAPFQGLGCHTCSLAFSCSAGPGDHLWGRSVCGLRGEWTL